MRAGSHCPARHLRHPCHANYENCGHYADTDLVLAASFSMILIICLFSMAFGGRTRTRTLDPLIKSQLTERRVSPCTDALEIVLSRARSSSDKDFDGVSRCRYT